ncbi:hypothetical protein [Rahnella sp. AA]|uniref:hypothetical protein n=1 Tax=Rahnella sp. AA TaxID=2057180 RepID=UPI0012FEF33E|nr:hypothetical protein [Rahnella sp. AA]
MPGEQTQEPVTWRTDYHFEQVLYAGEAIFFAILANKPAHAKDNFVTLVTFILKSAVLRYIREFPGEMPEIRHCLSSLKARCGGFHPWN